MASAGLLSVHENVPAMRAQPVVQHIAMQTERVRLSAYGKKPRLQIRPGQITRTCHLSFSAKASPRPNTNSG